MTTPRQRGRKAQELDRRMPTIADYRASAERNDVAGLPELSKRDRETASAIEAVEGKLCAECEGKGWVMWYPLSDINKKYPVYRVCPKCNGTGREGGK